MSARKEIHRFVDHATGYLVVLEQSEDRTLHHTLTDPRTGKGVTPAQRAAMVPAGEQTTVKAGFKLTTHHVVDLHTGAEVLHERLVELATGREVARGQRVALSEKPLPSLLEAHLERLAQPSFWDAYGKLTREERQAWWLQRVLFQMRCQGESGLDELAMFTPEAYADWLAHEPDMEAMIDFLLEHLPADRAAIAHRLGRDG